MEKKIIEILKDVLEIEDSIAENDKLEDLEGWDSLAVLTLSAGLEEEFDILISSQELETIITVNELIKYIKKNHQG